MLNRVGNGAAVAALPLAAAIAAASACQVILVAVFGALTVVVLVIACAPWIPFVRDALPGRRRAVAIESLMLEGARLRRQRVGSDDDLALWLSAWQIWQEAIVGRLPPLDAERVIRPRVTAFDITGSFNGKHSEVVNILHHQVDALGLILGREPEWARTR